MVMRETGKTLDITKINTHTVHIGYSFNKQRHEIKRTLQRLMITTHFTYTAGFVGKTEVLRTSLAHGNQLD
jgi:hypothetical protein